MVVAPSHVYVVLLVETEQLFLIEDVTAGVTTGVTEIPANSTSILTWKTPRLILLSDTSTQSEYTSSTSNQSSTAHAHAHTHTLSTSFTTRHSLSVISGSFRRSGMTGMRTPHTRTRRTDKSRIDSFVIHGINR